MPNWHGNRLPWRLGAVGPWLCAPGFRSGMPLHCRTVCIPPAAEAVKDASTAVFLTNDCALGLVQRCPGNGPLAGPIRHAYRSAKQRTPLDHGGASRLPANSLYAGRL